MVIQPVNFVVAIVQRKTYGQGSSQGLIQHPEWDSYLFLESYG